jgi:hypothetical protein
MDTDIIANKPKHEKFILTAYTNQINNIKFLCKQIIITQG